jgi:hypothetical protein
MSKTPDGTWVFVFRFRNHKNQIKEVIRLTGKEVNASQSLKMISKLLLQFRSRITKPTPKGDL